MKEENEKLKKFKAVVTIEEVERLKKENKKLRLELQNTGFPSDAEGFSIQKLDINPSNESSAGHNSQTNSNRQFCRISQEFSENDYTNRSNSPHSQSSKRKSICPRCNLPPPCVHISSISIENPSNTYRSTNSTESRYSRNLKIRGSMSVRYKLRNEIVEKGGLTDLIKENETRKKEMKLIKDRLGKLAELEIYRKAQFKLELEKLEADKRKNDEEMKKRQNDDQKRRRNLKEQKEKVLSYKIFKKIELTEASSRSNNLRKLEEQK